MIQSIRNIFSIPDLKRRILFTLAMIAVFRIGSFIPSPFLSIENLKSSFSNNSLMSGLFGVADLFTGGAFSKMTVMSLGIMPYISASIIFQILMVVMPQLEKMSKEGESGRKKLNQMTRYATVILALFQGFGLGLFLLQQEGVVVPFMHNMPALFLLITMVTITTGTVFLMWIGEQITTQGIGNGISLLIAVGIMAHYPTYIRTGILNVQLESVAPIWFLIIAGLCIGAVMLIILIQEGARKIPIQHAKQVVGRKMQAAQTNYLPLKVNTAGVMPVIFSMAILTLPSTLFGLFGTGAQSTWISNLGEAFSMTSRMNLYELFSIQKGSIFLLLQTVNLYTFSFIVLTVFFSFFYTAIVFNPTDVADNLRRVGAFVPGYRPGKPTAEYIDRVMSRITLVGAAFICVIALVPQMLTVAFKLPPHMTDFAGGTGLIIVVSVVLDTMKQIESRMLLRNYDGFKSRRQSSGGRRWAQKGGPAS